MQLLENLIKNDISGEISSTRIFEDDNGIITLRITRGDAVGIIQRRILNENMPELRNYGGCIEFVPISETQESVGLCWDTLILLAYEAPNDVWLNTYSESDIPPTIPIRRISFSDEKNGLLFLKEEFHRFVEL